MHHAKHGTRREEREKERRKESETRHIDGWRNKHIQWSIF